MLALIMRSRWHSAVAVLVFCSSLFVFPPLFIVSSGILALVCLTHGLKESLIVAAIASIIWWGVCFLVQVNPSLAILFAIWLPTILLAYQVKIKGDMNIIFIATIIMAIALWLLIVSQTGVDSAVFWQKMLVDEFIPLLEQLQMEPEVISFFQTNQSQIATNLNSAVISAFMLVIWISLFIGRAWQAKLYNPNGFANDFKSLSMGKGLSIIGLAVVGLPFIQPFLLISDLQNTFMLLFLLQGLSVAHFFITVKKLPIFVATLMYICIIIFPFVGTFILVIGAVDNWYNIRAKFALVE